MTGRNRARVALIVAVVAFAVPSPLCALEMSDTLAAWQAASAEEKSELAYDILGRESGEEESAKVIACLDEASDVPGQADELIADIAKACKVNNDSPL